MNKWATIAGVVLIAGFCALGFVELSRSHMPYVSSVSEVKAADGRQLQFAGTILHDTAKYDPATSELVVQLSDEKQDRLLVRYEGVKPANFDTAPKAVVTGTYYGKEFVAKRFLTSCPSKYQGK